MIVGSCSDMGFALKGKFGPSLERPLHLGHLRVALVNTAYVKIHGAEFLLRLEDTASFDKKPATSIGDICTNLEWACVTWTEGLGRGGPHAPYIQSDRLEHYFNAAERLLSSGDAYVCDCSRDRLKELRRKQIESGSTFRGYDGYCRDRRLAWNRKEAGAATKVLRYRVPQHDGEVEIFDQLRACSIKQNLTQIEDFILVRSNRVPTYYLACAVDDEEMGVNLMLRANEGEGSALRLKLVRQSLGFQPVQCGFLPIMRTDAAWGRPIPSLNALRRMGVDGNRLAIYLLSLGKPKMYESLDAAFEGWAADAPLKGANGRVPAMSMETIKSFIAVAPSLSLPDEKVAALIVERDEARRRKQYIKADRIRMELEYAGISISDGPNGTSWERAAL